MKIGNKKTLRWVACAVLGAVVVMGNSQLAYGQSDDIATRDAVFTQLQQRPNDTALMLRYARLSADLGFYEGTISTLERLLDIEPGNIEARFHLGVAYFALGSYKLANVHFQLLLSVPNLNPTAKARILQFTNIIDKRTQKTSIEGFVSAGISASSQTENGSTDTDFGYVIKGEGVHRHDLGGPHENYWVTETGGQILFNHNGLAFEKSTLYLRSGPFLTMDGETFGLKMRPFIEADIYAHTSESDAVTVSGGLQFQNAHGAMLRSFASIQAGHRWREALSSNGTYGEGLIGLGYRPMSEMEIRTALFGVLDQSENDNFAHKEWGAKISSHIDFDNPLFERGKKWALENYAQYSARHFECDCDDRTYKLGAALRAHIEQGLFADFNYDFSRITNNNGTGATTNHEASITLGQEF